MAAVTPQRARLGRRLRELRAATYPTGLEFAQSLGWPQSRVSKLERGAQLPTKADLETWLDATQHPRDELLGELLDLAAAARVDYVPDRAVTAEGGFAARQQQRGVAEAATWKIVEYQPAMLPGLVQTPAYARELLAHTIGGLTGPSGSAGELEALVAERVRRQNVLYQPGQRVEILVGEAALYTRPGERATMIGQLDRLLSLAALDSVTFGVVPFEVPLNVLPLSNFTIHDDRLVIIESLAGEQRHDDSDEVKTYLNAATALWSTAAQGDAAVHLIRRASERHRQATD